LLGKCNFLQVTSSSVLSKWTGESEKAVREVFSQAALSAPCVLFFDEIDALGGARGDTDITARRVVSEILLCLDRLKNESAPCLFCAATNIPASIDPALQRRFDVVIEIGAPSLIARRSLVSLFFQGEEKNFSKETEEKFAHDLEGCSIADIKGICRLAAAQPLETLVTTYFSNFTHTAEGADVSRPPSVQEKPRAMSVEDLHYALAQFSKRTSGLRGTTST
jgi:SpoVK/Ycf46/Vps4 family AAA+-type ATPase